ncbi:MAG TPA: biotin/lipoyl-binding protein, partial [Armatimonadota bacterium]|nr:biotin/lipoyl-binding protein [Armatimonadota bacterium]
MVVKKKRRVPWGWIWALFLVGGGAGYWFWDQQARAGNASKLPPGVQVGKAERGNIDQKITATGVVAAQTGAKVNIGARVSGRISSLPADVGTLVRAGQVVAVLETPELQAQVEQQRQSVAAAEAGVQQAQSRLEQAKLNATLSVDQNRAQIEEASSALQGASERLQIAEAAAQRQPTQTATEIARAEAALSTARSQERQVQQTVNLQLLQAQTSIDDGKAAREIAQKNVKRQVGLLAQGYTSQQDADEARTIYRQAVARLQNAEATLDIVKQKTQADLQAAKDQVTQAEATLTAARAGKFQNLMSAAEERSARQARKQSEASLALRRSNRTQDVVRRSGVVEAKSALVQARASLQQARAQLRFQETQLAYGVIRSPIT